MMLLLTFFCLASPLLVVAKDLIGTKDPTGAVAWSAEGGVSNTPLKVWQPNLPSSEWRMIGQYCSLSYGPLGVPIRRYKHNKGVTGKLARPEGFQFIWDDRGSTVDQDGSAWRVSCPPGFVATGDFFYAANRIAAPNPLFQSVACVKLELTEKCNFGGRIWFDKGTWALYDLSVWEVKPGEGQQNYFYVNNNHDNPPGIQPRCIKKDTFIDVWDME